MNKGVDVIMVTVLIGFFVCFILFFGSQEIWCKSDKNMASYMIMGTRSSIVGMITNPINTTEFCISHGYWDNQTMEKSK